jgi:hypothetical protein
MCIFVIAVIPSLVPADWGLAAGPSGPSPLKVVGTQIRTLDGKPVRLGGVNILSLMWGQGQLLRKSLNVATNECGANVAVHSLNPALCRFGRFVRNGPWMKSIVSRRMSGRGGSTPSDWSR